MFGNAARTEEPRQYWAMIVGLFVLTGLCIWYFLDTMAR